jgi:hypothetical protein
MPLPNLERNTVSQAGTGLLERELLQVSTATPHCACPNVGVNKGYVCINFLVCQEVVPVQGIDDGSRTFIAQQYSGSATSVLTPT